MTTIILASASPQRRHLMEQMGLPFKIVPSRAEEETRLTRGVAHLVRHNALLKAREVAGRCDKGLVIGCDTVVYSHKRRLILKPKDLKEARKNLEELMERPHWVYSGLALIDIKTGRTIIAHERTKVFMDTLNRTQIERYHRKVNPLDKAGGFDIEGTGALFIHRIEGCYYNVVGLPLARLTKMLKEFNVDVL